MLEITILTTTEDIASTTIKTQLLQEYPFKPFQSDIHWNNKHIIERYCFEPENVHSYIRFTLIGTDLPHVHLDEYFTSEELLGDIIIFASRHRSESERPALLCHCPGNWNDDISAGGKPFRIAKSSGILLYYCYSNLVYFKNESNFAFPVDQEVTHHGPTEFNQPVAFVELGSTEKEWRNQTGAKIVADAIIKTGFDLSSLLSEQSSNLNQIGDKTEIKTCIGFGGTHYMPNFSKHLAKKYTYAHTVPKYKVLSLTSNTIAQIIQRTLEPIQYWVIDWKGLNSDDKKHLIPLLEATQIPYIKTKDLK